MKIAFIDFRNLDYTVESAYQIALGGSESAVCYLAEALAQQGHEVFLLNHTSGPGMSRGVMCLPLDTVSVKLLQSLDAAIALGSAGQGIQLRLMLGDKTRLILWTGHDINQPALQALHNLDERDAYDRIVSVSTWQRDRFHQYFGIDIDRISILRNAIGPYFCELFPDGTSILAQKSQPPILAYTSTPFRGLNILLEVFPKIRQALPGTRLKVFSSMRSYPVSEAGDRSEDDEYGWLYRQCHETEGVEYIGSLPQPELARELQSVMLLAYPNTFAETSCIAVMEAMASGCQVVTSDLGALSETTAGFAHLIRFEGDWEIYKDRFVEDTVQVLRCTAKETPDAETYLRRQVTHVNTYYTWSVRAQQWVEWLSQFCAKPAGVLTAKLSTVNSAKLQQAYQFLMQDRYTQAATLYEQAIEADPTVMSNYWYLGLTFLLQGQQIEAQTTWTLAMMNGEPGQVDEWTAELVQVLRAEATRRTMSDRSAGLIEEYISRLE